MDLELGSIIQNKYRIIRLIGQGGMGAVYEGENTLIARRVAIKVLYSHVAAQHGVVERFEREAQAAGRIGNDHILEVLDMGTLNDGSRFMVMEFLDGETLGERVQRLGRLTAQQLLPLMRQLLVGLAAAHNAGIIHRDLKPDNVFILREKAGQPDFVKIIDFGISKFTALDQDMKMTATGAVMGTPYFMSPEQAKGSRSSDYRSDLYAVGVIIYKALTGVVPFDGATFNELLFKIVLSPVPQPREMLPDLDPGFESIVMKAMARDPAFRFQTAEAFIAGLDGWARTGAGVTVPPPEASGYNQAHVIGPSLSPGGTQLGDSRPATMGTEAKGTWIQGETTPPKSNSARWVLPALLVGAAGIAAAAFLLLPGANSANPAVPGDSINAAGGTNAGDPSANPAPLGAPTARVPEVSPAPANVEADVAAAASTAAADSANLVGAAPGASSTTGATDAPPDKPKNVATRPRPPARPPTPPPPPQTHPKPPKGGGTPDFGY